MSYLTKEQYQAREISAMKRMEDNAEIETLSEEQHGILADICKIRHEVHCMGGISAFFFTEGQDYDYCAGVFGGNGREGKLQEMLEELGLPETKKCIREIDRLVSRLMNASNDTDEDIGLPSPFDEDRNVLEDVAEEINTLHSEFNSVIEDFLSTIDEKHGTDYSPTGALRI